MKKSFLIICFMFYVLCFFAISSIQAEQTSWRAGETSLSEQTLKQKKAMLGALYLGDATPEVLEGIKAEDAPPLGTTVLPSSFDWRNYDGKDWTTPIKNQLSCGSCWAFASTAGVEARLNIFWNNAYLDRDYAEQYLISCSNAGDCDGGYGFKALDWMKKRGIPDEFYLPYQGYDLFVNHRRDINMNLEQIFDWHWAGGVWDSTDVAAIQNEIIDGGPVSTYMDVYDDFLTYLDGVYEPGSQATFLGGHLVAIVGWDDNTTPPCWIVKNSWGTGWGENGYFKIKKGTNVCNIEIQTTCAEIGE